MYFIRHRVLKELFSKKALTYRGGALIWVSLWTILQATLDLHPIVTAGIIVGGKHIMYSIMEAIDKKGKVCRYCLRIDP